MSKYTTGEMAKLCNVSVRTIQYYDNRKILVPTELSEGGRRLYSESDLTKMKVICYLKDLGLSLDNIARIMLEDNSSDVIDLILEEQRKKLEIDIKAKEDSLNKLDNLQRLLKEKDSFNVNEIFDIAIIMENKNKLNRLHLTLVLLGLPISIFQWVSIILWIVLGIWWFFLAWLLCAIIFGIFISRLYFKSVSYICPDCHNVFNPSFKEAFFAYHTPKTRKLKCPNCGYHGLCVETYRSK